MRTDLVLVHPDTGYAHGIAQHGVTAGRRVRTTLAEDVTDA